MKDPESKGAPPSPDGVPEGVGFGTPKVLVALPGVDLISDGEWFAEQIRIKYPDSQKSAKNRLLANLQKRLPPESRPGRPPRADVTEALRLESEGLRRTEIYHKLRKNTREEQRALLEAMRQRKARRRRRTRTGSDDQIPDNTTKA